jgi:hypothetical protein
MVEVFCFESVGKTSGLAVPARGERRIVLAEAIAHPLWFGMTNEGELHSERG